MKQRRDSEAPRVFDRLKAWSQTAVPQRRGRRRPCLEPLEPRCLLSTITEYPTPNGASGSPAQITVGPNNTLWFIESGSNAIASLSTTSPSPTLYPTSLPAGATPVGITLGPNGNIYFTELVTNQIGMINPSDPTHTIQNFGTAQGMTANSGLGGITSADGFLWFAQSFSDQIGRLDPGTGHITEFNVPTTATHYLTTLTSNLALADGNLWFTEFGAIVAFNPLNPTTDGTNLNVAATVTLPGGVNEEPFAITAGPGNTIWYTDENTATVKYFVGAINTSTDALIFNPEIPSSKATGIAAGPDGNIWLAVPSVPSPTTPGTINMLSLTNGVTTPITINPTTVPTPNPTAITVAPDGNLWFTDADGAIGVVRLDTHLVVTAQPPPDVSVNSPFGLTVTDEYTNGAVDTAFHGNVTVTIADNPVGGSFVPGVTTTVTAVNGVANFGLELNKAGMGYVLGASSSTTNGPTATNTVGFNVVNGPATQFIVAVQPVNPVPAGGAFTVTVVDAYVNSGPVDTAFNGSVNIALAANPGGGVLGGNTLVTAVNGVATFPGLTISNPGNGYTLVVASNGVVSTTTAPFNIANPPPPAPTISGEVVAFTHKMKKGKPVGKPIFAGYTIDFSEAMDQTSLANGGNYQLGIFVVKIVKRKKMTVLKPIGFTVTGVTSNSVTLKPRGNQTFPKGGQLTVLAGGALSAAEVPLAAGGAFNISKGGKGIS